MNRKRLINMVTMLREVQAKAWRPTRFSNMESMLEIPLEEAKALPVTFNLSMWSCPDTQDGNVCGFSACAVGHAMVDKRFPALLAGNGDAPYYKGHTNWTAVAKYFGIDEDTAEQLFMDSSYGWIDTEGDCPVTAAMVADRIQSLLDGTLQPN